MESIVCGWCVSTNGRWVGRDGLVVVGWANAINVMRDSLLPRTRSHTLPAPGYSCCCALCVVHFRRRRRFLMAAPSRKYLHIHMCSSLVASTSTTPLFSPSSLERTRPHLESHPALPHAIITYLATRGWEIETKSEIVSEGEEGKVLREKNDRENRGSWTSRSHGPVPLSQLPFFSTRLLF